MSYENWKDKAQGFQTMDVRHIQGSFFEGLKKRAEALEVGAGRMRQAARELVKAYIHGVESAALDDVFELLAWNQGIGFFSSEIGPSALFQAYKLIKNGEKQGKSREDICSALREKFGEKNPEMQVLNR